MNEFMDQFLVEARELVQQATDDWLALETAPADRGRIESVFRAVHTLKGAAGIMDFDAMGRALHALEDVLARVQSGADPVTARLVGDGLSVLDQVTRWLDVMETQGAPPADADAAADTIVARFVREVPPDPPPEPSREASPDSWLNGFLARHREAAGAATVALRYTPDPECFFRGEDPLALAADLPGIVALEISPALPWPVLAAMDPFACNLTILALSTAGADELRARLGPVHEQMHIQLLRPPAAGLILSEPARALLDAQIKLLAGPLTEGAAGRIASAGRVAVNVLRHVGKADAADAVERATAQSLDSGATGALSAAIAHARDWGAALPVLAAELTDEAHAPPDPAPTRGAERSSATRSPVEPYLATGPSGDVSARVLRVDMERIDALVTLAGELTVAKNALAHTVALAREGSDPAALTAHLIEQHAQLDRLVGQLQQTVASVRLLPVGQIFNRFPRLLREIAGSLGKPARLVLEGEATEADKSVVDALFEPLLHGIRNALDHGIEPPAERERLGKAAVATVRLRAAREGEQLRVEVEDDGRGVDVAAVRVAAAQRGLLPPDALAALTDEQALDLVFAPGFSTAAAVTGLSGRGVGMDAVRGAIERMGGRVVLESRPGRGTTLRLTLPFSLMLTRVMTVEADGQVFGIPLDTVVETVRIARSRIVPVGAARAFLLRDRTVPLVALGEVLGQASGTANTPEANVVVVAVGDQLGGFEVERLGSQMEVMLKPVEGLLADASAVAGTTLLGDGRVLIVLDPQELLA